MRIALAVLIAGCLAAPASGSVLLTSANGTWFHQHTRVYTYAFDPNVPAWFRPYVRQAAAEWDAGTILTLRETNGPANIEIRNGDVRGACGPNALACAHVPFHAPGWEMFGAAASQPFLPTLQREARHVACHELGHSLGLNHGGTGCLRTEPQPLLQSEMSWLAGANEHPGSDDLALLNRQYPATGH